jgi:hypothetical protein
VGARFFPLDEELRLLPGELTPRLQQQLVRLGTWIPSFEQAAKLLTNFTRGVRLSSPTARRQTETAGAVWVQLQEQAVERLEREAPEAPAGPDKQFLSTDGAFVPLVGGEWAEVKTLAIGTVQPPVERKGETIIRTQDISYFSRLTDCHTFQRLALVETHQRGVENAGAVGAVMDGAEWCQDFINFHRPGARRILDFPHAGERLGQIGQAVYGADTPEMKTWMSTQLHALKHDGPADVLAQIRELIKLHPELPGLSGHLAYLEKREAQMQYPAFQAEGWPIGDGVVESANKLVVEARLKGSGMHWARPHVDPMLALRNVVYNDRWDEVWPQIAAELRRQNAQRRSERRQRRQARRRETSSGPSAAALTTAVVAESGVDVPIPAEVPATAIEPAQMMPSEPEKPKEPWRPAADHPWRRPVVLKTKRQLKPSGPDQKL